MPLQAIKISNFNTPLMREMVISDELKVRIQALYQADIRYHSFATGEQAIQAFEDSFSQGNTLYVGMFNDKPICVVGCFVTQQKKTETKIEMKVQNLDFLAMHQQNFNRGIEEQFLKLIYQDKKNTDVKFGSNTPEILEIIKNISKTTRK